jgi:hypothetical protein
MTDTINRIVALAGPLPDEQAYRRYLATLRPEALFQKALELAEDAAKPPTRSARGWRSPRMSVKKLPRVTDLWQQRKNRELASAH